jgi:carboxylate-amine ligase
MAPRTVGVEEELMLVDPANGALAPVSAGVLQACAAACAETEAGTGTQTGATAGGVGRDRTVVQHELFLEQVEVATPPCRGSGELEAELRRGRRLVGRAARSTGVAAVAAGSPVLPHVDATVTPHRRYEEICGNYGEVARESLVCAMHVHVGVASDEEAVGVIDRIRPWLPVLLALSANSPYWRGLDTGFASWRSQVWGRWPSSGPADLFGTPHAYHAVAQQVIDAGAALDRGMLYFDARISVENPTVEIRVADVCTDVADAVLVAALVRALVETTAREWCGGLQPADWRLDQLRIATWRAAKFGVADRLIHPLEHEAVPVADVLDSLADYVAIALDESGDTQLVRSGLERVLVTGTGADHQRAALDAGGGLEAVLADLRERTEASWS